MKREKNSFKHSKTSNCNELFARPVAYGCSAWSSFLFSVESVCTLEGSMDIYLLV